MRKKTWTDRYAAGCEWCGARFPAIESQSCGLDSCHIIAREYASEHSWNVFLLCPNCHRIFDQVVKPKLQRAIHTALTGFGDSPADTEKKYVVAKHYNVVLKALVKQERESLSDSAVPEIAELTVWRDRPHKIHLPKRARPNPKA